MIGQASASHQRPAHSIPHSARGGEVEGSGASGVSLRAGSLESGAGKPGGKTMREQGWWGEARADERLRTTALRIKPPLKLKFLPLPL